MSLKHKSSLFVGISAALLFAAYFFFSTQYIRQTTAHLLAERTARVEAIAGDLNEFFARGSARLERIAAFPALLFGLETIEEQRVGKQIAAAEQLHYVFLESDVFTGGVYLLNREGRLLWSEPPDVDLLDTPFPDYGAIRRDIDADPDASHVMTVTGTAPRPRILISVPLVGRQNNAVGTLVGVIPGDHPAVADAIRRQSNDGSIAHIIDGTGRVIASTDVNRILKPLGYAGLLPEGPEAEAATLDYEDMIVAYAPIGTRAWKVTQDQEESIALADAHNLKNVLTGFAMFFFVLAVAVLFFVVRVFAEPIELLTANARQIAGGDLNVNFKLDRGDELGILASALNEMKSRLKNSYERLLLSEKMSLMGQIVAGIAHELNNPLTIVIGHSELLLSRNVDARLEPSLKRVHDGAERASKIVRNLLTFARQQKPERKATDINAVLLKTVELRAYELRVSNIELVTELSPLPQTMADAHQLQQVYLNLIVNAEQAMLEANGCGRLKIQSALRGDSVEVIFEDNGPGISPENLRRVFDPFFTTKAVGQGTGLGLSICEGIIAEHGGRLSASSTRGAGAKFVVELPVVHATSDTSNATALPTPPPAPKRVLVVDDEGHLRDLLQEVLTKDGHQIRTAWNGREALDLIRHEAFDLVITDIKMPETDGMELYRIIQQQHPDLCGHMLFVTGDLLNAETVRFLENNRNPWIAKPFELATVREVVNKALAANCA